jgi:hypothetical protein
MGGSYCPMQFNATFPVLYKPGLQKVAGAENEKD